MPFSLALYGTVPGVRKNTPWSGSENDPVT